MAAVFLGAEVVLAGVAPQTAVSAPGAGEQKQVLSLLAHNRDTAARTITAKKLGGTATVEIGKVTLAAGERGQMVQTCVILDGVGETVTVESDDAAATTEPIVDVAIFKVP